MPPATEVTVHQAASRNAWAGRASAIGISITSGGTGKNELSANETAPMIQIACGLPAAAMQRSYRRRTSEGLAAWVVIRTPEVSDACSAGARRARQLYAAPRERR